MPFGSGPHDFMQGNYPAGMPFPNNDHPGNRRFEFDQGIAGLPFQNLYSNYGPKSEPMVNKSAWRSSLGENWSNNLVHVVGLVDRQSGKFSFVMLFK